MKLHFEPNLDYQMQAIEVTVHALASHIHDGHHCHHEKLESNVSQLKCQKPHEGGRVWHGSGFRHSRAGGSPVYGVSWAPAFAGETIFTDSMAVAAPA